MECGGKAMHWTFADEIVTRKGQTTNLLFGIWPPSRIFTIEKWRIGQLHPHSNETHASTCWIWITIVPGACLLIAMLWVGFYTAASIMAAGKMLSSKQHFFGNLEEPLVLQGVTNSSTNEVHPGRWTAKGTMQASPMKRKENYLNRTSICSSR